MTFQGKSCSCGKLLHMEQNAPAAHSGAVNLLHLVHLSSARKGHFQIVLLSSQVGLQVMKRDDITRQGI